MLRIGAFSVRQCFAGRFGALAGRKGDPRHDAADGCLEVSPLGTIFALSEKSGVMRSITAVAGVNACPPREAWGPVQNGWARIDGCKVDDSGLWEPAGSAGIWCDERWALRRWVSLETAPEAR